MKLSTVMSIICILGLLILTREASSHPLATEEIRYTKEVKRDKNGRILRRADVLRAFRKVHACPSTKQYKGKCPGWHMDHVVPLACGGIDAVYNLQWLSTKIKSGAGYPNKDRWERKIYENELSKGSKSCENEVIIIKE